MFGYALQRNTQGSDAICEQTVSGSKQLPLTNLVELLMIYLNKQKLHSTVRCRGIEQVRLTYLEEDEK